MSIPTSVSLSRILFEKKKKRNIKKSRFLSSVKVVFILKEQQEIEKIGNNIDLTYFFYSRIWQKQKKNFFKLPKGFTFYL